MIPLADRMSSEYLEAQRTLHAAPRGYGGKGARWAETAREIATRYGAQSVLDYGCGQGTLAASLRSHFVTREYDPAIAGKDGPPSFADLVVCTDVLEHVEPDKLPAVLTHLRQLARRAALLVVSIRPANKILPDGRNAHLIIRPRAWWQAQVEAAGFSLDDPPRVLPPKGTSKVWIAVVRP